MERRDYRKKQQLVWRPVKPVGKITLLPNELIIDEIITKSDDLNIINICNVDKRFREICDDDKFWQKLYYKHFAHTGMDQLLDVDINSYKELFRLTYLLNNISNLTGYSIDYLFGIGDIQLTNQNINKFPLGLFELDQIDYLDLQHNNIEVIPREINTLRYLTHLDLHFNQIKVIPEEIYLLSKLVYLNLAFNKIIMISDQISQLKQLEYLNLSANKLNVIPSQLPSKLKFVNFAHNNINIIPSTINNLQYLLILDIHYNYIKTLPNINNLQLLEYLILSHNPIKEININQLDLVYLSIVSTAITKLPKKEMTVNRDNDQQDEDTFDIYYQNYVDEENKRYDYEIEEYDRHQSAEYYDDELLREEYEDYRDYDY